MGTGAGTGWSRDRDIGWLLNEIMHVKCFIPSLVSLHALKKVTHDFYM